MPSVIALRAILGACLGIGALDLVWINVALAPQWMQRGPVPIVAAAQPEVTATPIEPVPGPTIEPIAAAPSGESVYFTTMSTELDPKARTSLERVVEQGRAGAVIGLEGHADYRGDEALNQTLSKDRAGAVRNYLVRRGVPRSRIRVGYVGEARASGELWRDRRVDIQITGGPP